MATANKIAEGLYLVKLRATGGSTSVTVPEEIRHKVAFFPEGGFIAVRAVGPVVILAQVRQATQDGATEESDAAIDQAIREWLREPQHAAKAVAGAEPRGSNGTRR